VTNIKYRITFRKLIESDAEKIFLIYSNKEAMKYRGSKALESIMDAKQFIINQKIVKNDVLTIRKGVEIIETKELIGSVMFRFRNKEKQVCEIGYSIGKEYWGKGFGHEIVKKIIETSMKNNDIETLKAWTHKENISSVKILEKNGFKKTKQNEYVDSYLYHLSKNDWTTCII